MKYERFKTTRAPRPALLVLGMLAGLVGSGIAGSPEQLRAIVAEEARAQSDASASQDRIDHLDDETQKLLAEYRQVTAETESMRSYNAQLAAQVPSQNEEVASIQRQLQEVETTQREVLPMMQRMLDTLEKFVALEDRKST